MEEGEVNKTEVAQITSESKVAHAPTRCDTCRTIPCLNNKQITKQNLVLEKGPFKHERISQFSRFKGTLGDTPVTGTIRLDPPHYQSFVHYINGEQQTSVINPEWADFSENIKTFKYRYTW